MRKNLPVTTVEHPILADALIVSKTDPKGKLVYFNKEFVEASGFIGCITMRGCMSLTQK